MALLGQAARVGEMGLPGRDDGSMRSQMGNVTPCKECRGTGIAPSRLRSDDPSTLGEEWYSLADDLCPRCNGEGRRARKMSLAEQFNLPLLSR
jgi:hypothetical protein